MIRYVHISNQAAYRTARSRTPDWLVSVRDDRGRISENYQDSLAATVVFLAETLDAADFDAVLRTLAERRRIRA